MKIKVYESGAIPEHVFTTVSELLIDAFSERREQGINFQCGTYTPKDVENEFLGKNGCLLLAIDENGEVVGTRCFFEQTKGTYKYISLANLAVSNNYKGKGIASILFNEVLKIAIDKGYDFMTTFTATTAESAVRYHLKMGFIIYEKSYGKDYDSYSFIYPLKKFKFIRFKPFSYLVYTLLTSFHKIKN